MSVLFEKRFFLFDFARGRTLIKDETRLLLETLKRIGYNGICLHLEGFFETEKYPGIVRKGYLKKEEAKWICELAKEFEMELIPITNLVGHAESFVYHQERFAHMRRNGSTTQFNLFDGALEELALNIIDEIVDIYKPFYLHIGGDETELNGEERAEYAKFLSKLCGYIREKGIEPCIWGDMLMSSDELIESFTKDVTVFDWYYYGHRPTSLEKFKSFGFKDIFACPCNQGWDGVMGTQHHAPWWGWPTDEVPIEFNEIEAFLDDAAKLGIKNALVTDWENNNGHNLWSSMDANARAGLFMTGIEASKENIENALFGKQTPHSEITYLLQKIQHELYMAVLDDKTQPVLKCRMSDAFFSKAHFTAWVNISANIIDRVKVFEADIYSAQKLLEGWKAETELESICKKSLTASLYYTYALFALMKFSAYGYEKYHEAAVVQFEAPEKAVQCVNITADYLSKLIEAVKTFKEAQSAYLELSGQTRRDICRLKAFSDSMTGLKDVLLQYASHISVYKDDVRSMKVLPGFQMLLANIGQFEIMI